MARLTDCACCHYSSSLFALSLPIPFHCWRRSGLLLGPVFTVASQKGGMVASSGIAKEELRLPAVANFSSSLLGVSRGRHRFPYMRPSYGFFFAGIATHSASPLLLSGMNLVGAPRRVRVRPFAPGGLFNPAAAARRPDGWTQPERRAVAWLPRQSSVWSRSRQTTDVRAA